VRRLLASLPATTMVAAALAVVASAAWVRLGPIVPAAAVLTVVGLIVAARQHDVAALLLPLCLLPYALNVGGLYMSVSDVLVLGLAGCLLLGGVANGSTRGVAGPLTVPAAAFVAWTLASAVWAASPRAAVVEAVQRLEFVVFGVAVMASLPPDGRHARRALTGIVTGSAILGAITVTVGVVEHRYVGVYPVGLHKNAAGSLLSYGLLAALGIKLVMAPTGNGARWLRAASLVTLAGLIATGSRGAWVGTVVAAAAVIALRRPRLAWPTGAVTVVLIALFLLAVPADVAGQRAGFGEQHSTAAVRAETWQDGVEAIVAHPLLGVGAGNFVAYIFGQPAQGDPNNLLLLTWAETGLPGLGLLVWFVVAALALARRNARALPAREVPAAANLAGAALLVTAVVHAQFDIFWTRGTGLAAFLGAGLVVWATRAAVPATAARRPGRPIEVR
jgi:putative inorganic carbon (HCO3(-)) transporter